MNLQIRTILRMLIEEDTSASPYCYIPPVSMQFPVAGDRSRRFRENHPRNMRASARPVPLSVKELELQLERPGNPSCVPSQK